MLVLLKIHENVTCIKKQVEAKRAKDSLAKALTKK